MVAGKAEAKNVAQEHAKTLTLKDDAIRELRLVRRVVDARVSEHNAAVSKELDAHMTGLWDEFSAQ